ncbi:hypothetical protein Zmor_009134 [Zophobas morio]|uniref:Uncharacterized protein n=1 Tax=Zophobas morio TaxID=2755281 RepID=A0AA38MIE2_9CUCU|nr:hypothetical protein Zmor_009134 [Zophobas morio]
MILARLRDAPAEPIEFGKSADNDGGGGSLELVAATAAGCPRPVRAEKSQVYFLQYFGYLKLNIAFVGWHFGVRRADQYDSTLLPPHLRAPCPQLGSPAGTGLGRRDAPTPGAGGGRAATLQVGRNRSASHYLGSECLSVNRQRRFGRARASSGRRAESCPERTDKPSIILPKARPTNSDELEVQKLLKFSNWSLFKSCKQNSTLFEEAIIRVGTVFG